MFNKINLKWRKNCAYQHSDFGILRTNVYIRLPPSYHIILVKKTYFFRVPPRGVRMQQQKTRTSTPGPSKNCRLDPNGKVADPAWNWPDRDLTLRERKKNIKIKNGSCFLRKIGSGSFLVTFSQHFYSILFNKINILHTFSC